MLSEYGKTLRKIRIDKGLTLAQMAKAVGITSAYLSTIERGKRNIPKNLTQDIVNHCGLSNLDAFELRQAEYVSIKSVEIELVNVDLGKRMLVLWLADNLEDMTCEQVTKINKIMGVN